MIKESIRLAIIAIFVVIKAGHAMQIAEIVNIIKLPKLYQNHRAIEFIYQNNRTVTELYSSMSNTSNHVISNVANIYKQNTNKTANQHYIQNIGTKIYKIAIANKSSELPTNQPKINTSNYQNNKSNISKSIQKLPISHTKDKANINTLRVQNKKLVQTYKLVANNSIYNHASPNSARISNKNNAEHQSKSAPFRAQNQNNISTNSTKSIININQASENTPAHKTVLPLESPFNNIQHITQWPTTTNALLYQIPLPTHNPFTFGSPIHSTQLIFTQDQIRSILAEHIKHSHTDQDVITNIKGNNTINNNSSLQYNNAGYSQPNAKESLLTNKNTIYAQIKQIEWGKDTIASTIKNRIESEIKGAIQTKLNNKALNNIDKLIEFIDDNSGNSGSQIHGNQDQVDIIVIDPQQGNELECKLDNNSITFKQDITLEFAKNLQQKLIANGFIVYLTRHNSTNISQQRRSQITEYHQPSTVLSINTNRSNNSNISGISIYYTEPKYKSQANIQQKMKRVKKSSYIIRNRIQQLGIKMQNVQINNQSQSTHNPSLAINLGYITNIQDAYQMLDSNFTENISNIITNTLLQTHIHRTTIHTKQNG